MGRRRSNRAISEQHELMRAVEALSKMMVPDIILPIQLRGEPEDRPEDQLMRCVLLGALEDFVDSYKPSRTPLQAERRRINREVAESWFAGDPGAPIEFEHCCQLFGMSADEMRQLIARLRARLAAASRPQAEAAQTLNDQPQPVAADAAQAPMPASAPEPQIACAIAAQEVAIQAAILPLEEMSIEWD
jgi:hypothetical protein